MGLACSKTSSGGIVRVSDTAVRGQPMVCVMEALGSRLGFYAAYFVLE